jgi:hypothetical protein
MFSYMGYATVHVLYVDIKNKIYIHIFFEIDTAVPTLSTALAKGFP